MFESSTSTLQIIKFVNINTGGNVVDITPDFDFKTMYKDYINNLITGEYPNIKLFLFDRVFNTAVDYDVSEEAIDIYMKAWHHLKKGNKQKQGYSQKYEIISDQIYRGDTMNSFMTTFKMKFLRSIVKDWYKRWQNDTKGVVDFNNWIALSFDEIFKDSPNEVKHCLSLFDEYAKLTHTIGNFIPIPLGFNDRFKKTEDYWDQTLTHIYNYYQGQSLDALLDDYSSIMNTHKWLSKWKTWDEFVEENYLQDFVHLGKPIVFWDINLSEYDRLVKFLSLTNKAIVSRGKRILDKC